MIYKINKTGLKGSVNFFSVDYRSINPIQNGGGKERGEGGVSKKAPFYKRKNYPPKLSDFQF